MDNFDEKKWADLPDTCISKISMIVLATKIQSYITKKWFKQKNYSGHAPLVVWLIRCIIHTLFHNITHCTFKEHCKDGVTYSCTPPFSLQV